MAHDSFDDARLTAVGLVRETWEGLASRLDAAHARNGLSGSDFDALVRIARSPGRQLRMSDLAAQTSMSNSGATRVVDRLEQAGLVDRGSVAGDRRASYAVLTPVGLDRLLAGLPDLLEVIDRWFTSALEPEQLDALLAALTLVRDRVRPGAAAGSRG